MYNWSTDESELKKDPAKQTIWRLEQLLNFGLNNEKISEVELRQYWSQLNIDPARRRFIELLLNG